MSKELEELKEAIRGLIRLAARCDDLTDEEKDAQRIATAYVEHGPMPQIESIGYVDTDGNSHTVEPQKKSAEDAEYL